MLRTVLLRHSLPDGSWHHDWLVQCDPDPAAPVPTFRTSARVDDREPTGFDALRIGDHRPLYLAYEGPISGGRGEVSRVAAGEVVILSWADDQIRLDLHFDGVGRRLLGCRQQGNLWRFERVEPPR
ncbi:MAG TPA: hypothetical protein ENJ00_01590 [Phycisphaerales bacterium]|nr:hypothetical protein [Phycisphaerales bacterium]